MDEKSGRYTEHHIPSSSCQNVSPGDHEQCSEQEGGSQVKEKTAQLLKEPMISRESIESEQ